MPRAATVAAVIAVVALLAAVTSAENVKLNMNADGTFKITQFADIHFTSGTLKQCSDISPDQRPCSDYNTTDFIARVLDAERPNLAVFTGDNVSGPLDAEWAIEEFSAPCVERGIPWAAVFGNHDSEGNLDNTEMMQVITNLPYAVSSAGPADVDGVGNYILELIAEDGSAAFNLFFLDSGAYSQQTGVSGYDWVRPSQVAWYLEQSAELEIRQGGLRRSMTFFHIPLLEYEYAGDNSRTGDMFEGVYHADINSGLFAAFLATKHTVASFLGHDHVNDYCGLYPSQAGMWACYGGGVGYGTYGREGWERRARVIEITQNGSGVTTHKRLDNEELTVIDVQTLL